MAVGIGEFQFLLDLRDNQSAPLVLASISSSQLLLLLHVAAAFAQLPRCGRFFEQQVLPLPDRGTAKSDKQPTFSPSLKNSQLEIPQVPGGGILNLGGLEPHSSHYRRLKKNTFTTPSCLVLHILPGLQNGA